MSQVSNQIICFVLLPANNAYIFVVLLKSQSLTSIQSNWADNPGDRFDIKLEAFSGSTQFFNDKVLSDDVQPKIFAMLEVLLESKIRLERFQLSKFNNFKLLQ